MTAVVAGVCAGCFSADSVGNRQRSTPAPARSDATPAATSTAKTEMKDEPSKKSAATGFSANLPGGFEQPRDEVGRKMLAEYGAMFVARGVTPPPKVVFRDEPEVSAYQGGLAKSQETIGGIGVELQTPALEALKKAIDAARAKGISIRPRNADSSRRSYAQTVDNWKSRVHPGLAHWVSKGRLTKSDADRIAALSPPDQVPEIFKLEAQGMYFSKDLTKTIMYSVAPPGTSQHISLLALDVEQHEDARARSVLAEFGWFQTIPSDLPHFTYLGAKADELPGLGLKKVTTGGREFWVPDI